MRIDEALSQLSVIQEQVLRSETFRGYRAISVAATSALAIVAACVQGLLLEPSTVTDFVLFWIVVASLSIVGIALDLAWQLRRCIDRRNTWLALRQLVPALGVGAALTLVLLGGDHEAKIPAVWALCYGLGVVASLPYLPRGLGLVALFYLAAGVCLLLPAFARPLPSPYVFAAGQGLAALLLRRAELRLAARERGAVEIAS